MTYEQFTEKFNITLNEQQSAAVTETEGAVLLLAVPGSGKTTVLVARLGYMIFCRSIAPPSILTMTYTVAATKDMRARFASFFGEEACRELEFRTINGVCAGIIRTYERLGGSRAFSLLTSEKEIASLLSSVYREITGSFPTESDIKGLRTLITYAKNMMLSDTEIKELDSEITSFSSMYRKYCDTLKAQRLMDYDDQMVYALRILERYPQILSSIQSRYRYICVDEAQDTSKIQHRIISLLSGSSGNLFMVGDEDQSIYGFRAAYPQALMDFEKEHKGAKVLLMEENFRSGEKIVGAADRFISRNTNRRKKSMRASRADRDMIKRIALSSRLDQYAYLLSIAKESTADTAVLYRDNESALPLVDIFERNNIPFRMRAGDMTFFTHRIVQDIKNIILFAHDPCNTDAFMQIYYKISSYLSRNAAAEACEVSRQRGIPVWNVLFPSADISSGVLRGCRTLKIQLDSILKERGDKAVSRIFNAMGYSDYLDRMGMKSDKISILSAIGSNELTPMGLIRRLGELERLVADAPSCESGIILSTIHSSKGLEYDTVYLIDVYDGMFPEIVVTNPKHHCEDTVRCYEEERRLFYVGITRARNRLCILTYDSDESSFCNELLCSDNRSAVSGNDITEDFLSKCTEGSVIVHRLLGSGRITEEKGDIITVDFENGTQKKLSLKALFSQKLLII